MENNRKELIRKIQTLGEVYTILSRATRLPYVICDPESFNDQVWIFESKEDLEKAAKPFADKKNTIAAIKVENKSYLSFYTTLYTLGVNAVVFYEKEQEGIELDLEEIVRNRISLLCQRKNSLCLIHSFSFPASISCRSCAEEETGRKRKSPGTGRRSSCKRSKEQISHGGAASQDGQDQKNLQVPYIKNNQGDIYHPLLPMRRSFGNLIKRKNSRLCW